MIDKWWSIEKTIDPSWPPYDKSVAKGQLADFGVIYCEKAFGRPIDNEFDLDMIHGEEVNHGTR